MKGNRNKAPRTMMNTLRKMTIANSLVTVLLVAGPERVADLPNVPNGGSRPRTDFRICL